MTQTLISRSFWQTGAHSDGKPPRHGSRSFRRPALAAFVALIVISVTVLQKIAVPINIGQVGGPVQAALPLMGLALLALAFFVSLKIDMRRLLFLVILLVFAAISIAFQSNAYSINSVIMVISIYIPFLFYIEVSGKTYHNLIKIYLDVMIAVGAVVFLQHFSQLIWTWRVWPNLNQLIPQKFQFVGYDYIQPIKYGLNLMKPNGIFFLEVSCISQFTAIAFAVELVYFQRLWRMIFYSSVLLACFAGTGLLLLLVTGPVLLNRLSPRSLAVVGLVSVACVITAIGINWLPMVQNRFTEFQQVGSSSYYRFVVPFQLLLDLVKNPSSIVMGAGPGNIPRGNANDWWVITKIAFEYGLLTTIAFFVYFGYILFKDAPSQRIAFLLFVYFNFSGGFAVPIFPILVFLIGGLFRIRGRQETREQDAALPALAPALK